MDALMQHLRFALRQLARNPGFTATVILTLALSIGVNTAIFSLVNALLLKSLPYPHPERMGAIYNRYIGGSNPNGAEERSAIDGEKWELLRDNAPSLISAVSSGSASGVNLQAGSKVQYLHQGRISAHYLDVLGIHPAIGRNFTEVEDRPHGPRAAILSYSLWHSIFGTNPSILGTSILLKGEPYTVIGILPEGAITPFNADLYTAIQPSRQGEGQGTNYDVITRLRDGATWQQADAEINRAWAVRAQRFARSNPGVKVSYRSVPLQKGETDPVRPASLALMLSAGFILVIACANLAGLTLVRMMHRQSEIATRLALGATNWQIQRQLWIENLVLAILGGAIGLGAGFLALRGLLRLLPEHFLPVAGVSLDGRVLAFTLLVSLLTSIFFGMLPALSTRKTDLRSSMTIRTVAGTGSLRLRQLLIAAEVALTVLLLVASGLLIRTLIHLETLPRGFDPQGVLTAKASLDDARYHDPTAFHKLLNGSLASMRQIPGVEDAAVGLSLPYERSLNDGVTLSDRKEAGQQFATDEVYVTPGYFHTLRIPLLAGRAFTEEDGPDQQPVVIVNQTFVRKFYHGDNPIGRIVNGKMRIVGMVADVAQSPGLDSRDPLSGEETIYIPAAQFGNGSDSPMLALVHTWFQPSWIVRSSAPIEGLSVRMQRALASADPNLPFSGFYSMSDLLTTTLATQRVEVALLTALASLALLLSAIGIFSLVANMVVQRSREIGIRIALGSTIRQAMIRIGSTGLNASAAGLALGLLLCAFALRAMRSVIYGIGVYDTPTILSVVLVVAAITILATIIPVLKIAHVDPAKTLREE